MPSPKKRGRPPGKPRTADELLDELENSGCDRAYVLEAVQTLSDVNWGRDKWKPPSQADISALKRAAAVLERLRRDWFLYDLLRRPDRVGLVKLLGDTSEMLRECAEGMLAASKLVRLKPSAERYLRLVRLFHHVEEKTGRPRWSTVAKLLTAFGRHQWEVGNLKNQFKRADRFFREHLAFRKEFPRLASYVLLSESVSEATSRGEVPKPPGVGRFDPDNPEGERWRVAMFTAIARANRSRRFLLQNSP